MMFKGWTFEELVALFVGAIVLGLVTGFFLASVTA
jgi:hypothetical protein